MDKMKVIGLMLTWNNLEFFKCALKQALDFCDEVIVVEGCHSKHYPKHSTDGTCEYIETMKGLPKLIVKDFDFNGRYDNVQRRIRQEFPKDSALYKQGNWIFHWDDDCFFLEKELPILRNVMEQTGYDAIGYANRNFIYNFRFNSIDRSGVDVFRIVGGLHLSGISNAHYSDGRRLSAQYAKDVTLFHYNYVKKPERFKARMAMSVEKGTKASVRRYERWMAVKWDKDEDIFKSKAIVESIVSGDGLNIYRGEHPEAVANHPWRNIDDVREAK